MSKPKLTPNAQRQAALARLRDLLRLPLVHVASRKVVSRSGFHKGYKIYQIDLILEGGEIIRFERASILLSQQRTRVLVLERVPRVIPDFTRGEWEQVVRLIVENSEEEHPGV